MDKFIKKPNKSLERKQLEHNLNAADKEVEYLQRLFDNGSISEELLMERAKLLNIKIFNLKNRLRYISQGEKPLATISLNSRYITANNSFYND